jgi:HK97 family phage major capsid protein
MTHSIQALREQRNTAATALQALVNGTKPNDWSADHETKYDNMVAEIEKLDGAIERVAKAAAMVGASRDTIDGLADRAGVTLSAASADEEKRVRMFAQFLKGGEKSLDVADLQAMAAIRNAQSAGTNSAGGFLVPATTVAQLLVELKAYGGMRSVAQILQTASGESMSWPTVDDTSQTGELIAENAAANNQDATFGNVSLVPYKFSSKVFAVSYELMQDSAIDVVGIVNSLAATRIGRIQNTFFTTGTGTAQPRGAVTASAVGKTGATGQTTSVIYDDLVDLEHSVDPAYRANGCSWMMNDSSLKVLKKLKDSQNRPLWLPGLSGLDGPVGQPSLMGYGYAINQDMANMAANAKSILFGAFGQYVIRDVMSMLMFRFDDSAYAKNGQVGFLAWLRSGGNFVASSNSSLKHYANSAT